MTYTVTLWLVLTVNFALPRAMPGDPIYALQDPSNSLFVSDDATRERLLGYYGLDRSMPDQYAHYLAGILTGDLGWSIRYEAPVSQVLWPRLGWTALLVLPALLLSSLITLVAGAYAGWRRGSRADRALVGLFSVVHTIPVYFLGIAAILLFGARLGWFPLAGATTPFRQFSNAGVQVLDVLRHWTLPELVLLVEMIGGRFLLVRNTMVGVLDEDYVRVARAKGLPERTLKYRHGLRNALLPFASVFATQIGFVVTGTIFVETLFAYPGMGRLLVEAVGARDYPLLQSAFLVAAASVLVANFLADLMYPRLDPRIRASYV